MAVEATPPSEPVSWLFVEDAAGGTITGPDDEHLKLKLNKVRKYITAFTDRPIRQADALPNADFFTDWPQMFAGDPPNAVLSYSLPSQSQPLNIVLTLTNPQYDALKRTVSYDAVRILQATDIYLHDPDLAPFQTHKTPQRFGKASLFIDDATTYAVGDTGPAGGIVFYLTPDTNGTQGMETAPVDQSFAQQWGCSYETLGGTSAAFGTGEANTNFIINHCGTDTAAYVAYIFTINGVHGWYLPSKDELAVLYENNVAFNLGFFTGSEESEHWSSTEYNANYAYQQLYVNQDGHLYEPKSTMLSVRAVRAF